MTLVSMIPSVNLFVQGNCSKEQLIGADVPGAVGADAPIDGRSMGAVHP